MYKNQTNAQQLYSFSDFCSTGQSRICLEGSVILMHKDFMMICLKAHHFLLELHMKKTWVANLFRVEEGNPRRVHLLFVIKAGNKSLQNILFM